MRHPFVDVFVGLMVLSMFAFAFTVQGESVTYTAVEEPQAVVVQTGQQVDSKVVEQRIERQVREAFPEDPETAVQIARAESEFRATAYNPEAHYDRQHKYVCTGSLGVMQIACIHHQSKPEELENIELNLQIAHKLYVEGGWMPWGVCHNGKVDCGI